MILPQEDAIYMAPRPLQKLGGNSPLCPHMNQKIGICRHRTLYPLWLWPPFPNDVKILKPKVGLGPNQIKSDLRKVFLENITLLWKK